MDRISRMFVVSFADFLRGLGRGRLQKSAGGGEE
jgi:hypothetical protein